ncbi:G-protein coupled receptor GRL101-like [Diadema antillarum]|uniref:G-protein coupled receptor GRL101-like n=1 Tax=Diadema antillarum TaxID=105358 RepID=UPI003A8A5A14
MANTVLRVFIWILGISAFVGNAFVIGYRLMQKRRQRKENVQASLITNLAVSDFLMGLYMITIAGADAYYRGDYAFRAEDWKASTLCIFAGMVSVISSEASVLMVMLISLDRCVHVVAPFKRGLHLAPKTSHLVELFIWMTAFLLSLLPIVLSSYFNGEFYGQTGVCLALPLTSQRPSGWLYSLSIFICANFVAFIITFWSYVAIFLSVKTSQRKVGKRSAKGREDKRLREEIKLATKMALIVGTDLLCWMPIIIMGLMSSAGSLDLPAEVYAWTAVFIMPVNSSLNPYLYTISTIYTQYKRRQNQETTETKTRESVNFELTTSLITPFTTLPSPAPQRMCNWLSSYSRDLDDDELKVIERDLADAMTSLYSEGLKVEEFLHVENLAVQTNGAGRISQAFLVLDVPLPLGDGKIFGLNGSKDVDGPSTRNLVKLQNIFDRLAIRRSNNKL